MLDWLKKLLRELNPFTLDETDPFNQAAHHYTRIRYCLEDKAAYNEALIQTIRYCQLAIRKDRYHGGAHVLLANAYSLAAPIDPPEAYKFCMELAAAVIHEWKTNGRMYTKRENVPNGSKMYQRITARMQGKAGLGMFTDISFGSMADIHRQYYHQAVHESSLAKVRRLLAGTDEAESDWPEQTEAAARHVGRGEKLRQAGKVDEALGAFLGPMDSSPADVAAYLKQGLTYAGQDRWDEVVRACQAVLQQDPNCLGAYLLLGMAYSGLGQPDKAIRQYQAALDIDPDLAEAHYCLGALYGKQGQTSDEIREYRIALRINPEYAEAHNNLGNVYAKQARWDDAIRRYQDALRIDPSIAEPHIGLGSAYYKQGRLDEAIRECKAALRIEPDSGEAHNTLGLAYQDQGRWEESIREHRAALRIDPGVAEVHLNLSAAYLEQGRMEDAIRELQTAKRLGLSEATESLAELGL